MNHLLREQIVQRLYSELDILAESAAKFLLAESDSPTPQAPPLDQLRGHLLSLADSVLMNSPALFEAHLLQARQQRPGQVEVELRQHLMALRQALLLRLNVGEYVVVAAALSAGSHWLSAQLSEGTAEAAPETDEKALQYAQMAADYLALLLAADRRGATRLLLEAARSGTDVRDLYLYVLQPAQREVGNRWHSGEISVAEEHYCTAATAAAMAQLQPYFQDTPRNGRLLLAACISGDLHTLGLQMVADFLEHDGWEVRYLGASTPIDSILRMIADQGAELVLTAASMAHHVPLIRELVAAIRRDPATRHVRVVVGGRPFRYDNELWERTGADAWAPSADQAVDVVRGLFRR